MLFTGTARWGYRTQARQGPIKVISEQMTNVDGCYLALLYLGGYYLSSLLYDVNQQVALLQQLVFLPRRVHLDRSSDKRQSAICCVHYVFFFALIKRLARLLRGRVVTLKSNTNLCILVLCI